MSKIKCFIHAGKVHGSLARAGKVRGQAPKVAKQDKKKLPKGRAFKRVQYNRRFVNVGMTLFLSGLARHGRFRSLIAWHLLGRVPTTSRTMLRILGNFSNKKL